MKKLIIASSLCLMVFLFPRVSSAQKKNGRINVLVLAESQGDQHQAFVDTAKHWLQKLSAKGNIHFDYFDSPDKITDEMLAHYQLIFQLNYPPYRWNDVAQAAFIKYITEGKGGWVGLHHATLLGEFDGYSMWPWFSEFMGGIRYKNYIASFVSGQVRNEAYGHPVMKNIPKEFLIAKEEFYVYEKSPRPNVHVLASVDESTYKPNSAIVMGDHPVVWSNENFRARNVYIFMGHDPGLFDNMTYVQLLTNAIFWAGGAEKK